MKRFCFVLLLCVICVSKVITQTTIDQNGYQTTVINSISANALQAKRFEVATVIYNSHHWQNSSIIIVDLYNIFPRSGYERYHIEIGFGQGAQGLDPAVTHMDSDGIEHNARVVLGTPTDHTTSSGGYVNRTIPIYVDVRYYSYYVVKITHLRQRVTTFTDRNQIRINETPLGVDIEDFQSPSLQPSSGPWSQSSGHLFYDGSVGIGTSDPGSWKLAVNGKIRAKEIKVETGWPDFVFLKEYHLPTLEEVEDHIKQKGHLENIPSAIEVAENGVLLGEMNAKLLQKIEELTLYTIQQEKKISSLELETDELKIQNKQLKELIQKVKLLEKEFKKMKRDQ